ncbi:NAD(P)H-binding protein [Paenibacillus profundus]|uniref:NAD(P)H-binding protein n=2 Tax=Paenibacillus TaxID=44249 RepID=A0ABS8YIF8_9BACL|nr:NAD(P)H-binding protein [Paenibacillus profundus]
MELSKKGGRIYEWDGFLSLFKDEKGEVATTMNAQKGRTALVVGATGLVGRELVRKLAEDAQVHKLIALVRRMPEQGEASWFEHAKLEWHVVNYDQLEASRQSFLGVDELFCCLGTTIKKAKSREAFRRVDYEYPLEAAKLAAEAGAKRMYVITAMGADPRSNVFYSRTKGEVEAALSGLPYDSIYFFRPSLLLGDRNERRTGEQWGAIAMRLLDPIFKLGPLKQYRAIPASVVAEGMVAAAKQPQPGVHVILSDCIAPLPVNAF